MNAITAYIIVGLCTAFVVGSFLLVIGACMLSSQLSQKRNEP